MAPSEEYALVRCQVGLLDRSDFGVLELLAATGQASFTRS